MTAKEGKIEGPQKKKQSKNDRERRKDRRIKAKEEIVEE